MRNTLVAKHCPSPVQEALAEREAAEADALQRERIEHWLNDAYTQEFKDWLVESERKVEPVPDAEGQMLYRCGMRDGIRLVFDHLNELDRKLRRRD